VLGIATFVIARGFGVAELVPLAVILVLAPLVAMMTLALVRGEPRLRRMWAPHPVVEGDEVSVRLGVMGLPSIVRGALVCEQLGEDRYELVLRRRRGGLVGSYRTGRLRRGVYRFQRAHLILADPFGLAERRFEPEDTRSLIVRPGVLVHDADHGGPTAANDGRARIRRARPVGYDLHAIREHEPGESLRRVDWKSTAKRGRLMVREMEDSPSIDLVIVLDLDAHRFSGVGGPDALDQAVRAAVALTRAGCVGHRRVSVVAAGARTSRWNVAGLGREWEEMLDGLAAVRADRPTPIAHVLADSAAVPRARSVILITPSSGGAPDRLRRGRGDVTQTVIVDVGSWAGRPADYAGASAVLTAERPLERIVTEVGP
jgi:uncharacterized protein (DUF58 family)